MIPLLLWESEPEKEPIKKGFWTPNGPKFRIGRHEIAAEFQLSGYRGYQELTAFPFSHQRRGQRWAKDFRGLIEHSGYILGARQDFKSRFDMRRDFGQVSPAQFHEIASRRCLAPESIVSACFPKPYQFADTRFQRQKSACRVQVSLRCRFQDTQAAISQRFFKDFFPKAIQTASQLRTSGRKERYVWTTGSWLLYEFLEQAFRKIARPWRKRSPKAILHAACASLHLADRADDSFS
jgi:hypothetical protein